MTLPAGVTDEMLIDALDSLTVAAIAQVFSPRHQHQLIGKSYSAQIAEILAPRLTAALAGRVVVQGWQDIENAPRDCSVLVNDRGMTCEAYFHADDRNWWLAQTDPHDFDASQAIFPTQWMPLPEPPATADLSPAHSPGERHE